MIRETTGWIVRTEKNGQHRYWTVGAVEAARAMAMAATAAASDTAHAVTRLGTFDTGPYAPTRGIAIEFDWASRPVTPGAEASELETPTVSCKTVLGEITFDIIVPETGVNHVEGCYRLSGGNWQVYYLTNDHGDGPPLRIPAINSKAVFSSGLSGVSGLLPADWPLNKKMVGQILADAVGIDGWVEMIGPDSLLLK